MKTGYLLASLGLVVFASALALALAGSSPKDAGVLALALGLAMLGTVVGWRGEC